MSITRINSLKKSCSHYIFVLHEFLKKNYTIHYPKEIISLIMESFIVTRHVVEIITSHTGLFKETFCSIIHFYNSPGRYSMKIIPQKKMIYFLFNGCIFSTYWACAFDILFYTESELDIEIDVSALNPKIQEFNDNEPLTLCVRNNDMGHLEIYSRILKFD